MAEPFDEDDDVIDLRALAMTMWRGKWIIAICALFGIVMGILAASQVEPRYRATAKLLIGTERADVMKGEGVMVDARFGDTTLQTHTEILRSTKLINRVIDELGLMENREFQPRPPEDLTAVQRARQWLRDLTTLPDGVQEFMMDIGLKSPPPQPLPPEEAAMRKRLALVNRIEAGMSLNPIPESRVISVSFTSGDPRLSARIANEITEQYLVDQLEGKLETTRNAVGWLSDRVEQLQGRVSAAEREVEIAYATLSTESGQSLDVTKQQIQSLNGALAVTRNELSSKEAQFRRLSQAVEEGQDLGALTEFRESPIIAGFRREESEFMAQLAALETTVPAGHPARVRLTAQIEEVRKSIRAEAARILKSIEIDLEAKRAAEEKLVAEIRALEDKAAEQAKAAVEIRQLEREAEASRILYENLLSRLQESSAEETLQTADARVISPAEIPNGPLGTSARRTKMLSTLLGLMTGVGLVFLMDKLNNTFRSAQQLEQMTGLGILGTIPSAGSRVQRSDVVEVLRDKPNSSLAESIRNLRTSILFSNVDSPPKVVMFTSSVPREGKSTTSMLLALTSRQMGKSAIIVDCDLRMPALGKVLKVKEDELGLLSVMNNTATLAQAIYKEPETGLHLLMTKSAERSANINAADVLASHRFRELVQDLSEAYDLVILDTPPTLVVTDARILASMADTVVFAVRWDKTPRNAVLEGLRELTSVDAKLTGLVFTMVDEAKASRYAYDGYAYYKGRYRDYYEV
ncbi:GumC family protein [Rhodovulum marinum]|uniref:non-specific protein-tyrosine kinase n=1 Tax=Rhodovulum marinum TaxID=320662 RepID=A0A4R2PTQ2_9RHOB|nr:polysaccharide biosynthesis tyrosine autokinase [Rhodovulum marinum]TCP39279.1 capsular exopolysaccharide synthesis family protein [Rhodovulum marinum]